MIHPIKSLGRIQIDQRGFSINFLNDRANQMKIIVDHRTLYGTSLFREYKTITRNLYTVRQKLDQNL